MTRNVKLDDDVYSRCLATAKGYYTMLRRRKKIEDEIIHAGHCPDGQPRGNGIGNPTARKAERIMVRQQKNEERIRAVEQAWCECQDDWEKEFIKQNLFEHRPMKYINLPMAEITMKRYRKQFLIRLAQNLHEI